jgi:hypothetical protein
MDYVRLGNFELYPEQINWSPPGSPSDYYGSKSVDYLLDDFDFDSYIEGKIGKGWRLPSIKEMVYLGRVKSLEIARMGKLYLPSISNYVVEETTSPTVRGGDTDYSGRIFFSPESRGPNVQPWMPGFFIGNSGIKNFKIQPVRDI